MDNDLIRSVALGSACAAFVAIPNLGALIGEGEQTAPYDTVITPPDYAFAVWGPVFAGCVADTVIQCRAPGRHRASSRRTGWPLAGAYALKSLWSIASQTRHFELTPLLLPAATGLTALAYRRLQHVPDPARSTVVSTGALLGWTSLASTVNLAAGSLLLGAGKDSRRTVNTCTAGLLAACAGIVSIVATSRRGAGAVATTSCWGLLTTAISRRRPRQVRLAAGAGAAAIAATAIRKIVRTAKTNAT